MDPQKEHVRFYIFTRMKLGDDATKIYGDLKAVYGESCASYHTVARWVEQFKNGKTSVIDEDRSGLPVSVKEENTLMFVKKMVEEDLSLPFRK